MRLMQVGAAQGPNIVFLGHSGRGDCCNVAHLIWLEHEFRYDAIDIAGAELMVEMVQGTPRLRFKDMSFAGWQGVSDDDSPTVVLRYDAESRRFVADIEAMRKPEPTAGQSRESASDLQLSLAARPADEVDPRLTASMLALIYTDNAAAARALLDAAWPTDRPGEDVFLTAFSRQLWRGALWQRFDLGHVLAAEAAFPPLAHRR
jgi:hypothetical protein